LEFLNTLLKDKDYVALAYITGIYQLIKLKINYLLIILIQSGWMSEYIGFTNVEVKELCTKQKEIIQQQKQIKIQKKIEIYNLNDSNNNTNKKRKFNNDEIENKEVVNRNYNELIYNKEVKKM